MVTISFIVNLFNTSIHTSNTTLFLLAFCHPPPDLLIKYETIILVPTPIPIVTIVVTKFSLVLFNFPFDVEMLLFEHSSTLPNKLEFTLFASN